MQSWRSHRSRGSAGYTLIWDLINAQRARWAEPGAGIPATGSFVAFTPIARLVSSLSPASSTQQRVASSAASSSAASSSGYKSCAALERLPLLAPEVPAYEHAYRAFSQTWNSRRFKRLPSGMVATETSRGGVDARGGAGASGLAGQSRWVAAPRETAADRRGDMRSLNRRLDSRLFLLVKRAGVGWGFVEGDLGVGGVGAPSSRRIAEEALTEAIGVPDAGEGSPPLFYFVGNAPAAHSNDGCVMHFYHRCQLIRLEAFVGSTLLERGGYEDYAWVGVDEMDRYLDDRARVEILQAMA